ncbi:unnamed protein product, partial [Clonostachys rosea f. rosea IK726]
MVSLGRLVQELRPFNTQDGFVSAEDGIWYCSCGSCAIYTYAVLLDSHNRPMEGMGRIQATCSTQRCNFKACWRAQDFQNVVNEFIGCNEANSRQDTVMRANMITGYENFTGIYSPNVHVHYQPVSFLFLQEFSSPVAQMIPFNLIQTHSGPIPQELLFGYLLQHSNP